MGSYKELIACFFQMESAERLFEIKDERGIYVWDLVRYYVFSTLLFPDEITVSYNSHRLTLRSIISKILSFFQNVWIILFVRKKYFFFLNSRNRFPGSGLFFDQNAYDTLCLLPVRECLLNEVYPTQRKDVYGATTLFFTSGILYRLLAKNVPSYDYSAIKAVIDKHFPNNRISIDRLASEYINYYREKRLYKVIFKRTSTKLLFVTQAGIRKGIYSAAKELSIPTIEFNHGIVHDGHMAYSYPQLNDIHNYNADYIFALSDFWFRDMFLPHTEVIPVGNNYFRPQCAHPCTPESDNRILVISSSEVVSDLKEFLIKTFKQCPDTLKYEFIFKLHPNQFEQKADCERFFSDYPIITVITNEKNVPQCMQDCSTMLVIESTAAFEALQMGRKVAILKRRSFESLQILFSHPNVHLVEAPEDLILAMNAPVQISETEYFSAFDADKARNAIDKILGNGRP